MLYFIKSNNFYKIGFTNDINSRMKQYLTENPGFILLGIQEGNKTDEAYYHNTLAKFLICGEWMNIPEEKVLELKEDFTEDVSKYLSKDLLYLTSDNWWTDKIQRRIKRTKSHKPENKKFVSAPNQRKERYLPKDAVDIKQENLELIDAYIYLILKRYMNEETKIAFPSTTTLMSDTNLSKPAILNSVKRLEKANYIKIIRQFGKANQYQFNDYKKFECFSYDFLDMKELSAIEKAYLVIAQPHMIDKDSVTQTGKIHYDQSTFANIMGISVNTLKKIEKHLQELHILSLKATNQKELVLANTRYIPSTGFNLYDRVYSFPAFCNELVFKIQEHDVKLDKHEAEIHQLKEENLRIRQELEALKSALTYNTRIVL